MRTAGNFPRRSLCASTVRRGRPGGKGGTGLGGFCSPLPSRVREWKEWATEGASESAREMAESEAAPPARGNGEAEAS